MKLDVPNDIDLFANTTKTFEICFRQPIFELQANFKQKEKKDKVKIKINQQVKK